MSVQETLIQMSSDIGAEPVQAVVVDATNSSIKRIIIEKVASISPAKGFMIGAAGVGVCVAGFAAYKYFQSRKAKKAEAAE